jgi:hypothetical protein
VSQSVKVLPKRLEGKVVFERVLSEALELQRLVESYRQRRPRDCEDEVTKDVFDALDDLEPLLAEVQGHLAVLKSSVRGEPHAELEALRAEKRQKATTRNVDSLPRGDEDTGHHRYRVAPHVLRMVKGGDQ